MTSAEKLQQLLSEINKIEETVKNEFLSLPDSTLNRKENTSAWSILECIEHLNRYCRYYNQELKRSIAEAMAKASPIDRPESTWLGKKFIQMMHPDNVKKQKTLRRMNPENSTLDKSVLEKFLHYQNELRQILHDAHAVNLNRSYVRVEFMQLLKMNLGDSLTFVVVHQQRHIRQAKNILISRESAREASLII
jgi:Na+/phosphate symporter